MADLAKGRVIVTNWYVFEPQTVRSVGTNSRVIKAGVRVRVDETIAIGAKTTTARGRRYLTPDELERQIAAGLLKILSEEKDKTEASSAYASSRTNTSRATRPLDARLGRHPPQFLAA
jgi:type III restriction enzyme